MMCSVRLDAHKPGKGVGRTARRLSVMYPDAFIHCRRNRVIMIKKAIDEYDETPMIQYILQNQ